MTKQTRNETVRVPALTREAEVDAATFNEKERTFSVVFSTGSRVMRGGFFTDPFLEELSLDPAHVRLNRLNSGAPFLNTHSRYRLSDILGVVEKAETDGKRGTALIRFSKRAEVEPILADIRDGIIRNISVGYTVHKFEEVGRDENDVKIFRAVDWEPMEISAVPVGADDAAKIRENSQNQNDCVLVLASSRTSEEGDSMLEGEKVAKVETVPSERSDVDSNKIVAEATVAERRRAAEIRRACSAGGLSSEFADKLVDDGTALDAARAFVIDEIAKKSPAKTESVRVEMSGINPTDTMRAGIENALLHRFDSQRTKLDEVGRQFRGMTLLDLARVCIERAGGSTSGMSRMQIAGVALGMSREGLHGTSDFPYILANVANKTLRAAYEAAPQTFLPITRLVTAPDFKQIQRTQLGDAPSLVLVAANGEVTRGTIGEGKEVYALATYAKIVGFTRQALINDDMEAFTRLPEMYGRAARDLESDLVWAQITGNPTMNDGVALFHSTHGNLGTTAAISETSLGEARKLLRLQTGLGGRLINVVGRYLYVPATKETIADQYTTLITPAAGSSVNPFAGKLTPIAEPRLDAASTTAWYMTGDVGQIDILELARLEGEEGPVIESRMGFDVEGIEFKARHDAAAKIIDHRGMVKNVGA